MFDPSTLAPPAGATAEFVLTRADFERVRQLIHRHAGIHLADGKEAMVYGRLARRLREGAHASFAAYLQHLEARLAGGGASSTA